MRDHAPISEEPVLASAVREFVEAAAIPRLPFDPGPVQSRRAPERARPVELDQSGADRVEEKWVAVSGGPMGSVAVRIVYPGGAVGPLPAVLYVHGAGRAFGSARTYDRLVRELAVGARAALVFPEYTLSPESPCPLALEECYAVARWLTGRGADHGIDPGRLAVAGDSVGGHIGAALTLLAKERGDVSFVQQVLFHPATDASPATGPDHRFAESHLVRRDTMRWFRDPYTADEEQRARITAGPLRATEERLAGLPPALVITTEDDVARDEGEAYAAQLRAAGVAVVATRYGGTIHDLLVLDALSSTRAARGAIAQAIAVLRQALGTGIRAVGHEVGPAGRVALTAPRHHGTTAPTHHA